MKSHGKGILSVAVVVVLACVERWRLGEQSETCKIAHTTHPSGAYNNHHTEHTYNVKNGELKPTHFHLEASTVCHNSAY